MVQRLRLSSDAIDQQIQEAISQLFQKRTCEDTESDLRIQTTADDRSDSKSDQARAKLLVYRSTTQLTDDLRQSIRDSLLQESYYADLIDELENIDQNELVMGPKKYKMKHKILLVHQRSQGDDVDYWRVVIPDDMDLKNLILIELHSVPHSAHPGVQRTLGKVRKTFFWRGMTGDVREFVESCPTCQVEKSDHTLSRGQLQSTQIPEEKWQEISLDFITDLPESSIGDNSILTVIDKATRMTHLIPCKKSITAAETAKLFWRHIGKLHGVPRVLYSDRGPQFIAQFWRELWGILGTQLKFSSSYHPQTQGVVERMNSVVEQTLRCLIHQMNETRDWKSFLPTVEFMINSLPNRSTGYSPFFLNYGYHPTTPVELIKGNEEIRNEIVSEFMGRMRSVWAKAKEQLHRSVQVQANYYDKRRRPMSYAPGTYVLLSTRHLRLKGTPRKLQRRFVGPFEIEERIGTQAYRLKLPSHWRIHNVFHVSLLKAWNEA